MGLRLVYLAHTFVTHCVFCSTLFHSASQKASFASRPALNKQAGTKNVCQYAISKKHAAVVVKRSKVLYHPGMSERREWRVSSEGAGERLDQFLTANLPGISRSAIQKAIKQEEVTVNGAATSVHHFLKVDDLIIWQPKETKQSRSHSTSLAPELTPEIIAETEDWIVLNKPRGLMVHPSATSKEATLVDWLVARHPSMARIGEDPSRPGIVHRLDREVSGLIVVAKTQAMFDHLKTAFGQRHVKKQYIALVHGVVSKDTDDIKLKIARSSKGGRMAARPVGEEGKAAWTHFDVKERFIGATLVDIDILSGRTHQIRAHFHGIGHPVIGDPLYKRKETDRRIPSSKLMLQSVALAFPDLDGTTRSFTLPMNESFTSLIEEFRRS